MPYSCKRLLADDRALFEQLLAVFGEAFADPETYGGAVPSEAYSRALLATREDVMHFDIAVK